MLHIRDAKTDNSDRFVPLPNVLYQKIKNTPKFEYLRMSGQARSITRPFTTCYA